MRAREYMHKHADTSRQTGICGAKIFHADRPEIARAVRMCGLPCIEEKFRLSLIVLYTVAYVLQV